MVCVNQNTFRQLISGHHTGAAAVGLRLLLRAVSLPYAAAVRGRNILYSGRLLRSISAAVPVISVGNITTGGTGKTPLVIWLCRYLESKQRRCAILTRGYKTDKARPSDEPALLAKACGDTSVVVDSDRVAGAQKAESQYGAEILVLDDGFQHRRLKRDLNILTLDATCPFGYGRILPAGLLREPLSALKRADVIVLTRYDQVASRTTARLEEQLARLAPAVPIVKAVHRHTHAVAAGAKTLPLDTLRDKRAFVFCGIGNPDAFVDHVRQSGMDIVGSRVYNDHHVYTQEDIKDLILQAEACGAEMLLCTQKDWVKTALLKPDTTDMLLAYLAMELEFIEGLEVLQNRIDRVLEMGNGQKETDRS